MTGTPSGQIYMYASSADEGTQCVIADLTVPNRGRDSDTFPPKVQILKTRGP